MAEVTAAARAGDVQRFLGGLEPGSRQALLASTRAGEELDRAMAAFNAVLASRFEGGPPILGMERDDLATALRRLAETEVLETRTTSTDARIRVRIADIGEETLVAVRQERGWGLVLGFAPVADGEEREAALARVTEAVAAGAYASRLDAMIAADRAVRGDGR